MRASRSDVDQMVALQSRMVAALVDSAWRCGERDATGKVTDWASAQLKLRGGRGSYSSGQRYVLRELLELLTRDRQ